MANHEESQDSWADDVSLLYPEKGWKPDEGELTMLEIEGVNSPPKQKVRTTPSEKEKTTDSKDAVKESNAPSPGADRIPFLKRKAKPFSVFLLAWLGTLSITIAVALGYFYNFLEAYENAYQASRPYHDMEEIVSLLESRDYDTLYHMLTMKPEIGEFETFDNVKNYFNLLLEGTQLDYQPSQNYSEDFPEYHITANGYIVGTLALRKSQTDAHEYNFPKWYISSFELYSEPQYDFRILAPSNCSISINGIPLSDSYRYSMGESYDAASYVSDYVTLPTMERYKIDGLYEAPVITAYNSFGEETEVTFNSRTGFYEVSFGVDSANASSMQAFAIETVSAYANYISNDLPDDGLDAYFVEGSEILYMIKAGTSRQYFAAHTSSEIQNAEVVDFVVYSQDCFYCEVHLEQCLDLSYYSEPEIIPVVGRFYFVRIDGEWKVCNIRY